MPHAPHLLVVCSVAVLAAVPVRAALPEDIGRFLGTHCLACHGPEKQESNLRLDGVAGMDAANRNLWTMVHERVASGEMPPEGKPRPAAAETKTLLGWIVAEQRALGQGSTRRLNRREQAAALRDLTGLGVDFAASLPGDGTVDGFDTGAEGLQDAADSVAQWMRTTRRAVDGLRFLDPPPAGKLFAADFRELKDTKKLGEVWRADGANLKNFGTHRPGLGILVEPRSPGERETWSVAVPSPPDRQGVLRLKVVVSVMRPAEYKIPNPRLWVEIGGKDLDYREITAAADKPLELEYEVQLGDLAITNKGVTVSLANRVELPYAVPGFENEDRSRADQPVPGGTGLYRPVFDRKTLPPEKQPAPYIVLHRIEIEPTVVKAWPPASWKADVGEPKDSPEFAGKLLALWTERAWRRSASEAERAPFLALYSRQRAAGDGFDNALRAAFQSVLVSAPFRYLPPTSHKDSAVAHHAIASRLSFMLVGSPPDAELRSLAAAGRLRDPAVLDAQVDRLLADPRSLPGFVRPFVTQWFELEQPITIAQDDLQKMEFRWGRYLKASMKQETISYVGALLAGNRPAKELVESDWTMMNDALARHYGYEGIEGGELRKVALRKDDPRGGGILGHAGIQSMLCWMGDNWVIYRGAWVLRHVLDRPPPPPPLEVPELNPADGKHKGKTYRELLRIHQEDKRCAVCHRTIDPAGFAFQNFDISGRWRGVEHERYAKGELDGRIAWKGEGRTRPVDSAGMLPRGEEFKTFAEFKHLVAGRYQADTVRVFLRNLAVYATGRKPDVQGMREIDAIMKAAAPEGYRLRDLVKATVKSKAFLEE
jgi:hypothetical protein